MNFLKHLWMLIFIASLAMAGNVESGTVIIDVRSDDEWNAGHIESAIHIPHKEIKEKIEEHVKDKATPVVLYCRSGGRAGKALKVLEKMGYTNVKNLGGMEDAKKALGK